MFEKITQLSHPPPLSLRMHGQLFVLMCKLQYRHFDVYLYMCVYVRGWHFLEVAVSCTQCTFRSSYVQEVSAQHRVLSKLTWPNISIFSAHFFRYEISKIGKKVYKMGDFCSQQILSIFCQKHPRIFLISYINVQWKETQNVCLFDTIVIARWLVVVGPQKFLLVV